jgi:hypothetical protein
MIHLIICFFISVPALAKEITYKPITIENQNLEFIEISMEKGKIKFVDNKKTKNLTLQITLLDDSNLGDDWTLNYKVEGNKLILNQLQPSEREKIISSIVQKSQVIPEYKIEIIGEALPGEIFLRKGQVDLMDWDRDMTIVLDEGKLVASKINGNLKIMNNLGAVDITNSLGDLVIDSYNSQLNLSGVSGNLKFDNFMGATRIQKAEGNIVLKQQKGQMNAVQTRGEFEFEFGAVQATFDANGGDLRGKSKNSNIKINLSSQTNFKLDILEGDLTISPNKSSANINISSKRGVINAPGYLSLSQKTNLKSLNGQLRGGGEGGNIFVKSDSANIKIK